MLSNLYLFGRNSAGAERCIKAPLLEVRNQLSLGVPAIDTPVTAPCVIKHALIHVIVRSVGWTAPVLRPDRNMCIAIPHFVVIVAHIGTYGFRMATRGRRGKRRKGHCA